MKASGDGECAILVYLNREVLPNHLRTSSQSDIVRIFHNSRNRTCWCLDARNFCSEALLIEAVIEAWVIGIT
jgi:hypothetical protein